MIIRERRAGEEKGQLPPGYKSVDTALIIFGSTSPREGFVTVDFYPQRVPTWELVRKAREDLVGASREQAEQSHVTLLDGIGADPARRLLELLEVPDVTGFRADGVSSEPLMGSLFQHSPYSPEKKGKIRELTTRIPQVKLEIFQDMAPKAPQGNPQFRPPAYKVTAVITR